MEVSNRLFNYALKVNRFSEYKFMRDIDKQSKIEC